jgi:hypothetical protein
MGQKGTKKLTWDIRGTVRSPQTFHFHTHHTNSFIGYSGDAGSTLHANTTFVVIKSLQRIPHRFACGRGLAGLPAVSAPEQVRAADLDIQAAKTGGFIDSTALGGYAALTARATENVPSGGG